MEKEQIPFPDKLVGWFDIAKGLGEIALEFVTKRHNTETKDYQSNHHETTEI